MNEATVEIPLAVVGCDFRVASSKWRSRLVLEDDQACVLARKLCRIGAADGFFDLNTCNRNEWIVSSSEPRWAAELLRAQMKMRIEEARPWLEPYVYTGEAAARHVFRVAIGQESLVVGERQIARQLYRALETARGRGISSRVLNGMGTVAGRLVRIALRRGCIENAAVGVHSLAVHYLRSQLRMRDHYKVAVVGLGRIGRRVLGPVEGYPRFEPVLCTRTVTDDQRVRPLSELAAVLAEVDAAVVCTGAMQPVIRAEHLSKDRPRKKPLLILDIGIPEQVESTGIPENVEVVGLDDLVGFYYESHGTQWKAEKDREVVGLVDTALDEFMMFCSEPKFSAILDMVQRHHRRLVGEEIPRLIADRFDYLPENARVRMAFDLKHIILGYTSEVFRTIKEASAPNAEDNSCQDES
jgi:glutamyl-tRNA reductase